MSLRDGVSDLFNKYPLKIQEAEALTRAAYHIKKRGPSFFEEFVKKSYDSMKSSLEFTEILELADKLNQELSPETEFQQYVEENLLPMIDLDALINLNNKFKYDFLESYILLNYHKILRHHDDVPEYLLTNSIKDWERTILRQNKETDEWLNMFRNQKLSKKDTIYYHLLNVLKPRLSKDYQDKVNDVFQIKYEQIQKCIHVFKQQLETLAEQGDDKALSVACKLEGCATLQSLLVEDCPTQAYF